MRAEEAGVEQRVVHRLDARLAHDLAGTRMPVPRPAELGLAHLAEQSEELTPETALRVQPRRDRGHLEPGEPGRPFVEVEGEALVRVRNDDRRCERRADHAAPDAREHRVEREMHHPSESS